MAIQYLKDTDLKQAIDDSEAYMKPFWQPIAELERLGRAKPGRVPKGKPRVTDGTLAGKRREVPKQVIQQVPTGKAQYKADHEIEKYLTATLTDEILPFANAQGTPYNKSKRALKELFTAGASAAYVYYDRTDDKFHANYKLIYAKDLLFEKGKISEFDSHYIIVKEWYTKTDLQAELDLCKDLKAKAKERGETYKPEWDEEVLQELIDSAEQPKDDENKSEAEKQKSSEDNGFILLHHVMQRGRGNVFFRYSRRLEKVASTTPNKDPRGTIPLHVLVGEEDGSSPLGEPIFSISAGKQNLLDFLMQMFQYNQGMQLDPAVKKWGAVAVRAVKIVPGNVIDMGANNKTLSDFETVDINTSAIDRFPNNYGLVKSQIINELGAATDTSVSSEAGNPGFSKTDSGVDQLNERKDIFNNDLRKLHDEWFGRVCETLLNVHLAYSTGEKPLDLSPATRKNLDVGLDDEVTFNYDQEFEPVTFTVDAGTSQAQDDDKKNERLVTILDLLAKYPQPTSKQMMMMNQVIQNSGIDDPEKYQFTDEDIEQATEIDAAMKQQTMMQLTGGAMQGGMEGDVDQEQLPEDAEPMPESQELPMDEPQPSDFTPEEEELVMGLQERGFSPEDIANGVVMLREGMADEQIIAALTGGQQ